MKAPARLQRRPGKGSHHGHDTFTHARRASAGAPGPARISPGAHRPRVGKHAERARGLGAHGRRAVAQPRQQRALQLARQARRQLRLRRQRARQRLRHAAAHAALARLRAASRPRA